jgi:hypothetical protein
VQIRGFATRYAPWNGRGKEWILLTLAVAAVAAEVAAARVLELAVAFGADADHV